MATKIKKSNNTSSNTLRNTSSNPSSASKKSTSKPRVTNTTDTTNAADTTNTSGDESVTITDVINIDSKQQLFTDNDKNEIKKMLNDYAKGTNLEFEVSFKNINYPNYMRISEYYVNATDKDNINTSNSLDISIVFSDKNVYRVSLLDENEIENFLTRYAKSSISDIERYIITVDPSDHVDIVYKNRGSAKMIPIDNWAMNVKLTQEIPVTRQLNLKLIILKDFYFTAPSAPRPGENDPSFPARSDLPRRRSPPESRSVASRHDHHAMLRAAPLKLRVQPPDRGRLGAVEMKLDPEPRHGVAVPRRAARRGRFPIGRVKQAERGGAGGERDPQGEKKVLSL